MRTTREAFTEAVTVEAHTWEGLRRIMDYCMWSYKPHHISALNIGEANKFPIQRYGEKNTILTGFFPKI